MASLTIDEIRTLRVAIDLIDEMPESGSTARELRAIVQSAARTPAATADRAPCPACSATGLRPLTRVEAYTIERVPAEWTPTSQIAAKTATRVTRPMLCNRLASLESTGLIESMRDPAVPREKLWRRKVVARG